MNTRQFTSAGSLFILQFRVTGEVVASGFAPHVEPVDFGRGAASKELDVLSQTSATRAQRALTVSMTSWAPRGPPATERGDRGYWEVRRCGCQGGLDWRLAKYLISSESFIRPGRPRSNYLVAD